LATLQAAEVSSTRFGGADVIPMQIRGVPAVGLQQDMSSYFDWHHTAADTLDKIDPLELAWRAGAAAGLAVGGGAAPEARPPPGPDCAAELDGALGAAEGQVGQQTWCARCSHARARSESIATDTSGTREHGSSIPGWRARLRAGSRWIPRRAATS